MFGLKPSTKENIIHLNQSEWLKKWFWSPKIRPAVLLAFSFHQPFPACMSTWHGYNCWLFIIKMMSDVSEMILLELHN